APFKIDLNIAAGDPAEFLESLPERHSAELSFRIVLRIEHQDANPSHSLRLLRPRRDRPTSRTTGNYFDEIASSHCLTPRLKTGPMIACNSRDLQWGNGIQRSRCTTANFSDQCRTNCREAAAAGLALTPQKMG